MISSYLEATQNRTPGEVGKAEVNRQRDPNSHPAECQHSWRVQVTPQETYSWCKWCGATKDACIAPEHSPRYQRELERIRNARERGLRQ